MASPHIAPITDRFGRTLHDLRVSVTDRCNFRCGYCMPADAYPEGHRFLPTGELLSFDEIERLVRLFVERLGVRKVRLTGGEPLIRPDLSSLVKRLARVDGLTDLTLTTNGTLLAEHALALKQSGLARITVSLDSLDREEFARMSGTGRNLDQVLAGIDAAIAAGLTPLKINCVVIRGQNEGAVLALAERFRGTPHVVRFIEYMDVGTQNAWRKDDVVSAQEILARIAARWPLVPHAPSYVGEVARRHRYADGAGEIGIISSVTDPFCGDCHRARLSADGRMLTCLFAPGGLDLRNMLRAGATDDALTDAVRGTWQTRTDRYSEERAGRTQDATPRRRLEMYQVGG
jgi:cyclic pyranopterin phosphate synthase